MSWLPLFPELAMISRPVPRRKPVPKQLVLFPNPNYARYGMKLKQQTPAWADKKAVAAIYRAARRLTRETGELHVVDHIVPINGGIVCGLHVETNLRVTHWLANGVKGARWWPDMPGEQQDLFEGAQ